MKVAIVAGEKSGDYLGSELIKSIKARYPNAEFVGLCGPLMQAEGAVSLDDMDKISLFGLEGLFSSIREILAIRKKLKDYFIKWKPNFYVGIDVPDFNLALERTLKDHGIPAIHYVSPTVWAWRGGRINKIRRSIDLMLALFPFEKIYYQKNQVNVAYVGHPLAKQIDEWKVSDEFLSSLNKKFDLSQKQIVALLPGSRMSEVTRLAPEMIRGAYELSKTHSQLQFVIPSANEKTTQYLKNYLQNNSQYQNASICMIDGHSRDVLSLCDFAVLASGTAALEAALFAKPMVVMYKVSWLSAFVFKNSITVEHFSMPNHLTDQPVVPELIQQQATSENMIKEVNRLLQDTDHYNKMKMALSAVNPRLALNSSELACDAIFKLLQERTSGVHH